MVVLGAPTPTMVLDEIFASDMVLPAGNAQIYGTATPGSKIEVTVSAAGKPTPTAHASAVVSAHGTFSLPLNVSASLQSYTVNVHVRRFGISKVFL